MSGYLQSVVIELKLTERAVVHGKGVGWGVASIPAQTLIDEEQVVVPDPIVEPPTPHPCDPAHALVHGQKEPKKRRDRISKSSPLVYIVP